MANIKITDLAAYTDPVSTDVLPIVDVGNDITKKVSIADLLENAGTGSASAPSFSFDGDNNTGIYRPGADQVAISTNGVGRLFVDSSGNVFIGGSTAATADIALNANGSAEFAGNVTIGDKIIHNGDTNTAVRFPADDTVSVETAGSERLRVDSSGRLLVGTSSSIEDAGKFQLKTTYNGALNQQGVSFLHTAFADTDTFNINFLRSRDNFGGNTAVIDGTRLGQINFKGYDGTDYESVGASIYSEVDGTPGANDMPGRLVFSTSSDGSSSPTERMRITNRGVTNIQSIANTFVVETTQAAGTAYNLILGRSGCTTGTFDTGTFTFAVKSNGNVQNTNNSYGALSDIKLKENIVDATSQWDDIKALRPVNYNFKEGQTHTQLGLIAQEVELVSPGLVSESPDRDEDGNDLGTVTKSVNYSVLYMKAVKALQEAMERIETLEQRLSDAGIA